MDSITMAAYPGPPNTGINSNHMGHMGHMGGISTLSNFDDIGRHGSIGTTPDYEGLGHVGQTHRLRIKPYRLEVRQQPATARVAVGKEKDRKPIDPPPVVQVTLSLEADPRQNFLQNPYLLMTTRLRRYIEGVEPDHADTELKENALLGTIVSSLYSLKDTTNRQGGFFVFGDLSCKLKGVFRLEFVLYEMKMDARRCVLLSRTHSDKFEVFAHKDFPGMQESTFLTRTFSDQGVRLRLRKDSRSMTRRKRNASVAQIARQLNSPDQNDEQIQQQQQQQHNGHRSNSYPDATTAALGPSRCSSSAQGGAYYDQGQRADYENGPHYGSYPHCTEEGRIPKRRRPDEHGMATHGHGQHDLGYPAPRTLPDALGTGSIARGGFVFRAQDNSSILPRVPTPAYAMPGIDTQMSPQQSGLASAPTSAATTFSLSLDIPPLSHAGDLGPDGKH